MQNKIVIGIVTRGKQVLIVRRKQKERDLLWQFPGGAIKNDETAENAIVRELKEETGINVLPIKYLGERIHPSTGKEINYWVCEFISGDLHISDVDLDEVAWVPIFRLLSYFTTPVYKPILDYLGI